MQQGRNNAALALTTARLDFLAAEYELDAVVIKGAALQKLSEVPRAAGDVDLVVPPDQAEAWVEMLLGEGWREDLDPPDVMLRWWGAAQMFPLPGNAGLGVDVHLRIESAPGHGVLDFSALACHVQPTEWNRLRLPDKPGLLLVAAVHWCRHDDSSRLPRWLADAEILVGDGVLGVARERARELGCDRELEFYLSDVQDATGLELEAKDVTLPLAVRAVHRFGKGRLGREVAWMAALGPIDGASYLADRIGPARFRREGGLRGLKGWLQRRFREDDRKIG